MKTESQVINELERLGGAMASGPSLVDGVMDRLEGLPPPVRTSARPVRIVLACSFAAAGRPGPSLRPARKTAKRRSQNRIGRYRLLRRPLHLRHLRPSATRREESTRTPLRR